MGPYKYTLNEDGTVDYIAPGETKVQNLSGRDTSSKEALEADLSAYTDAYLAGKEIEKHQASDGLSELIGKQQTAAVDQEA